MKRDFEQVLMAVHGEPMLTTDALDETGRPHPTTKDEGGRVTVIPQPVKLRTVAYVALTANFHDETNLSGDEKYKRYDLLRRILEAGKRGESTEVTAEEIALIKKLVGKLPNGGSALVGPVYDVLDTDPAPVEA